MSKLTFLGAAGLAFTVAGSAFAADLPPQMPVKASFVERFTWTGCYLGAHVGGAWMRNSVTDPVVLVQDNPNFGGPGFTTVGPTTVGVNQDGVVAGGQIGCDYQFPSNFVLGVEGAASGGTMKGSRVVALPDSPPDTALVSVKTDFVTALTGRAGYAVDHWLIYAKGGVAWANSKYSVTGTINGAAAIGQPPGTAFDFEGLSIRTGWTVGAGAEWAFAQDWSARLEYAYYDFGSHTATMSDFNFGTGPLSFKTTMQTVKLGVNFHMWGWQ
jgi:outer membrane immunogenic protein